MGLITPVDYKDVIGRKVLGSLFDFLGEVGVGVYTIVGSPMGLNLMGLWSMFQFSIWAASIVVLGIKINLIGACCLEF